MSTPLFFRIYKNEQIVAVKQFVNEERIVIGSGSGVQVDLQSPDVSAIHCLIEKRDDGYYLCDLGSEQGTYLSGNQVLDQQISSGQYFQIGPFVIYFMLGNQINTEFEQRDRDIESRKNAANESERRQQAALAAQAAALTASQSVTIPPVSDDTVKVTPVAPVVPAAPVSQPVPPMQNQVRPAAAQAPRSATVPKSTGRSKPLKEVIRPGGGSRVEVVVSWRDRIIETYHFSTQGERTIGENADIRLPDGSAPSGWKILNFVGSQIEISTTPEMKSEVLREGQFVSMDQGRFTIKDSDVCFIEMANGMQLAIRFAPKAPVILFDSPFVLGISEFTGVLAALILAVVTSLIVAVNKPEPVEEEENIERLAKVVFTKPPQPTPTVPVEPEPTPETPRPPEPQKTPPVVQKVNLSEKKQESKVQGQANIAENKKEQQSANGKAAEVRPKDSKLKTKMFTSTKQGGAIKTGEKDGANAKSKEPDLKNQGLLAAFGSGGARNKLDKAYSGSGELLGAGERATGTSGFASNRSGDDLGSKAKDTGAGGAGTATQGIAGVGTQGRGTGMAGLGGGSGFGDKGKVQIAAGGGEEEFTGSIDKEAVRRVVKSALAQFKACYEREYRMNSRLEGKVVIQWEIHEQGIAKNAKVVRSKSTINNSAVEECVKNRMLALKFPEPPPGTAAEVTYPFIFQGQKN